MNLLTIIFLCLILITSCTPADQDPWLLNFQKTEVNPVLTADSSYTFTDPVTKKEVKWQRADVFNPAAVADNDTVYLFYRAEDNPKATLGGRTSRIGLATSIDGINFTKYEHPVLYPDSGQFIQYDYPGGCEDPRVVKTEDGRYIMTYTSWNQDVARLSTAESSDLRNWKKHGPAFAKAYDGQFKDRWSKSGSIVTKEKDGEFVAAKIKGKYWMYWGDTDVFLAHSENLTDWYPVKKDDAQLLSVMMPRKGYFDSFLVEPGPPAIMTDDGILLLYNGMNGKGDNASPLLPSGTYCGGQALFDQNDPSKLLKRLEAPFICPDLPHEISGQYSAGTTFIEGLVLFKGKWFLYYGTADSMVGLAVMEDDK